MSNKSKNKEWIVIIIWIIVTTIICVFCGLAIFFGWTTQIFTLG